MCVAVQMALLVSCLCHAPTLGAHRKPPCRMAEQVSQSGFSWKNTWSRFACRSIFTSPPSKDQPSNSVSFLADNSSIRFFVWRMLALLFVRR